MDARRTGTIVRRRKPSLPTLFGFAILLLIAVQIYSKSKRERMPPLSSGDYRLLRINEDSSLTIGSINHRAVWTVRWMGIGIQDPERAAKWLKSTIATNDTVEIRLDRRRLDDRGNLIAYVFDRQGQLLNETLIQHGFATEATHPSDHAPMVRRLKRARSLVTSREPEKL